LLTLTDQNLAIDAWKMRVGVARDALPFAELGAYGTLNPDERGTATDATYLARLATLQRAHTERSAFDDLDIWVPVAYPRYGPGDGNSFNSYSAYTTLGITGARAIGPVKPVKPILTYRVGNGASAQHDVELLNFEMPNPLRRTLDKQLAAIEAAGGVSEALFWIGSTDTDTLPGSTRSVYEYLSPARPIFRFR